MILDDGYFIKSLIAMSVLMYRKILSIQNYRAEDYRVTISQLMSEFCFFTFHHS